MLMWSRVKKKRTCRASMETRYRGLDNRNGAAEAMVQSRLLVKALGILPMDRSNKQMETRPQISPLLAPSIDALHPAMTHRPTMTLHPTVVLRPGMSLRPPMSLRPVVTLHPWITLHPRMTLRPAMTPHHVMTLCPALSLHAVLFLRPTLSTTLPLTARGHVKPMVYVTMMRGMALALLLSPHPLTR